MTGPVEILRRLEQAGPTDRELLARFVGQRDQSAFAELVRRHGPVVFGVCRRVTGHSQDAEDAFQAVFLVLARKAARLGNPDLVGNWLYGVAVRVASKARRGANRRRAREITVSPLPDPPANPPPARPELGPILDEELAALPAWYRDAILLCDLRGVSREDAAAALGVPEGTLSSRLANGRKKLAARLTKRGVALSAAALPVTIAEVQAALAVPYELLTKTCGLVADWSAGGTVPLALTKLAEGGFAVRNTLMIGLVAAAVAVAGVVVAAGAGDDAKPVEPPKQAVVAKGEPTPDAKPGQKSEEKVAYSTQPRMRSGRDSYITNISKIAWSQDGKVHAHQGTWSGKAPGPSSGNTVGVDSTLLDSKGFSIRLSLAKSRNLVSFTGDGKHLITEQREYELVSGFHRLHFSALEVEEGDPRGRGEVTKDVDLDADDTHGYAFAADGKTFRTIAYEREGSGNPKKIEVREVDAATGKTLKSLTKTDFVEHLLSPNGKRLATVNNDGKILIYDVDRGGKPSTYAFAEPPKLPAIASSALGGGNFGSGFPSGFGSQPQPSIRLYMAFSPDGSRLVVSRAIGQTVVINSETGEALPVLEGSEMMRTFPATNAFTGDGRLLAMTGSHYVLTKVNTGGPKGGRDQPALTHSRSFLTVWDTQTGKVLKSWDRAPLVAFNPTKPILAILEPNGENATRLGLWDFSAEVEKK